MKLVNIINEEILKLEGVADTYGEKFGLPNPAKDMERKAVQGIKNLPPEPEAKPNADPKGEFIGTVQMFEKQTDVYANPKNLSEFEKDVRAVSTIDGDLFLLQFNVSLYHSKIIYAVIHSHEEGRTDFEVFNDAYNLRYNITWHRINTTDDFGYSISTVDNLKSQPELRSYVEKNLDATRAKNPQFNFIPMYWEKLKREGYDVKDIMQNNPYGTNDEALKYSNKEQAMEMIQTKNEYIPIRGYIEQLSNAWNLRELYRKSIDISHGVRDAREYEAFQILIDNLSKGLNYNSY